MRRHLLLLGLIACCVGDEPAEAQTFGEIAGFVRDASGAVIAGARISAVQESTSRSRSVLTNDVGGYVVPLLPPGRYRVSAAMQGFQSQSVSGLEVVVDDRARADFNLALGSVEEVVEVVAAAPLMQRDNAAVATVIDQKRLRDFPLNGRNYLSLLALSSNVVSDVPQGGARESRLGGERAAIRRRDRRSAARVQSLYPRRRREHGPQLQLLSRAAVARRAARGEGRLRRLLRPVRPHRVAGHRRHQVWNEPGARNAVRVSPQRKPRRQAMARRSRQPSLRPQPIRLHFRRSSDQGPPLLVQQYRVAARPHDRSMASQRPHRRHALRRVRRPAKSGLRSALAHIRRPLGRRSRRRRRPLRQSNRARRAAPSGGARPAGVLSRADPHGRRHLRQLSPQRLLRRRHRAVHAAHRLPRERRLELVRALQPRQ